MPAETWALAGLPTPFNSRWKGQFVWGKRIFDWWNQVLGCAVEVDGDTHDARYDAYRDEYNFRRSGIVVIRVANYDEPSLESARKAILRLEPIGARKAELRIDGNTMKGRRWLSIKPYPPALLPVFLSEGAGSVIASAESLNGGR